MFPKTVASESCSVPEYCDNLCSSFIKYKLWRTRTQNILKIQKSIPTLHPTSFFKLFPIPSTFISLPDIWFIHLWSYKSVALIAGPVRRYEPFGTPSEILIRYRCQELIGHCEVVDGIVKAIIFATLPYPCLSQVLQCCLGQSVVHLDVDRVMEARLEYSFGH